MRQPRGPRPPREPRAPREAASPDGAPPPGFSIPVRNPFGFGGFGGAGPRPPLRVGGQPVVTTPASPPIATPATPAATSDAPAEPAPQAPTAQAVAADATNAWSQHRQWREDRRYASPRQPVAQGETLLVHAWEQLVLSGRLPPQACTIWVRSVEPVPGYEFFIPGESVVGQFPSRALYDFCMANRRRRDVPERMVGRIRAPDDTGRPIELGGGELHLPPSPPTVAAAPWSTPGQGAPPWGYGYGAPPSPWGLGAPPWMGGGMPPWWTGTPFGALAAAAQPPAPPAAVQQDPNALRMWQAMQENQHTLLKSVIELASRPPTPAPAAPAPPDPFVMLERVLGVVEKLRPAESGPSPGITVTKVDEDFTLVTDKNGDVHQNATMWANAKGLKSVIGSLRNLRPNAPGNATNGPGPPRRAGLPATNGAPSAKPNGAS